MVFASARPSLFDIVGPPLSGWSWSVLQVANYVRIVLHVVWVRWVVHYNRVKKRGETRLRSPLFNKILSKITKNWCLAPKCHKNRPFRGGGIIHTFTHFTPVSQNFEKKVWVNKCTHTFHTLHPNYMIFRKSVGQATHTLHTDYMFSTKSVALNILPTHSTLYTQFIWF